jgi:MoxR-like ATPase
VLARSIDGKFSRIQFTPDLMPADITGLNIYSKKEEAFVFVEGPIMTNILLADEINRATPRTQSALLEAMQEEQVTVDGTSRALGQPFMVIATQNPMGFTGTFPLPEAQMDRFMMRLSIGYPDKSEEIQLLGGNFGKAVKLDPVMTLDDIAELRAQAADIRINESVKRYIVDIVTATRESEYTLLGASPRGSLALCTAAKSLALIKGRDFAVPEDVRDIACDVLSHRLMLSPKGKSTFGIQIAAMRYILENTPVPAE